MLAVVVIRNGRDDTLNCLRSVYASDHPGEIVVYVPDSGSTDGSVEAIREQFPAARVLDNGGNLGFAGGNNPAGSGPSPTAPSRSPSSTTTPPSPPTACGS